MENADVVVKPLKDFAKNSIRLVKRCTKPDRKGEAAAARVYSHTISSST
jgi:preprotein translocase subunit Sss1